MIDPDEALRRTLDLAARPTSEFATLDDALASFVAFPISLRPPFEASFQFERAHHE